MPSKNGEAPSHPEAQAATTTHYGRLAAVYEFGSYWGSGGQIQRSKRHHLSLLNKPSRILYPGCGIGHEVVQAAREGHHPTIVELDPIMLERAKANFKEQGVLEKIECIGGSILDHDRPNYYDVVVSNYLLDVFAPDVMLVVYKHLVQQIKPEGMLSLSGYAPLHGSPMHKAVQWLNHAYANIFCKLTVNNAVHKIYNYAALFPEMGLKESHIKDFPHFNTFGPRFHRMWAAKKLRTNAP